MITRVALSLPVQNPSNGDGIEKPNVDPMTALARLLTKTHTTTQGVRPGKIFLRQDSKELNILVSTQVSPQPPTPEPRERGPGQSKVYQTDLESHSPFRTAVDHEEGRFHFGNSLGRNSIV
jgi:hypothetical protein